MMWVFGFLACSDPVQEYSLPKKSDENWEDWSQKPVQQQGAPVGEALDKAPANGAPSGEPPPVVEGQDRPPPADVPDGAPVVPDGPAVENAATLDSGGCRPVASSEMNSPNGSGIAISGKIAKSSDLVGSVLLEFAKMDGDKAQTHYGVVCGFTETFELEVPAGLSDVYIVAFIDVNGDGPSPEDPRGFLGPYSFSEPVTLDPIEVELNADLSPLVLPFVPFISNMPVVNDDGGEAPNNANGDLPPPTTDVGSERETPDVTEVVEGGEIPPVVDPPAAVAPNTEPESDDDVVPEVEVP